ncbi:uncharacterized protein LOC143188681 [Calliopsis andreniformis]|uniref:uncharacterized protein LOC143188681 n=1 Tax=Calliopsis andreniformis TaxID=337506 RepID=UPI003FCE8A4B
MKKSPIKLFQFFNFLLIMCIEIAQLSLSTHHSKNDSIVSPVNLQRSSNSFVLVNPNQVQHLEKTLRRFLFKMAEPVKGPIILRVSSSNSNDLQLTIREVSKSIRKRLMQFAEDCNLTTTVQRYKQNSEDTPQSEDWFSEILLQGMYMLHDLGNMIDEVKEEICSYFDKPNVSLQVSKFQHLRRPANDFQFLGIIYDTTEFGERLAQCLLQLGNKRKHKASFDINRAIFNLTKHPPTVAVNIFKSNMKSSFHNYPKTRGGYRSWHAFLCFSLVQEQGIRYDECIRDVQRLEACLHSMKQQAGKKKNELEVKPWMKAIQRLSDCKIREDKRGKVQIVCKNSRKMPRDAKRKISYILERTLNRKISKKSPLQRAATDLGYTLSKSDWGQAIVDELCQYFMIYEDGMRKLRGLSSVAGKNEKAYRRYKEVVKSLEVYKKGIFLETFGTISKMHRSAVDFEKYLVNGIKVILNETWQSHVKILSCMMDWMIKLLELYAGVEESSGNGQQSPDNTEVSEEVDDNEMSDFEDDSESNSMETAIARSQTDLKQKVDIAMYNLMESMNHVIRHRSTNDKSMLACLANNLLLVTMFMEAMGFVSTLFSWGQPTREEVLLNPNAERNRSRRSLQFLDYQDNIDLVPEDYLLLKIYENLTTLAINENY